MTSAIDRTIAVHCPSSNAQATRQDVLESLRLHDYERAARQVDTLNRVQLNTFNTTGMSLLHIATTYDSVAFVRAVLRNIDPALIRFPSGEGPTAMDLAISQEKSDIVREIALAMSSADLADECRRQRVTQMPSDQLTEAQRALLDCYQEALDRMSRPEWLLSIAVAGHWELFDINLIEEQTPAHRQEGNTALHYAVRDCRDDVARDLAVRMRPQDLILENKAGYTAIDLAGIQGDTELAEWLSELLYPLVDSVHPQSLLRYQLLARAVAISCTTFARTSCCPPCARSAPMRRSKPR